MCKQNNLYPKDYHILLHLLTSIEDKVMMTKVDQQLPRNRVEWGGGGPGKRWGTKRHRVLLGGQSLLG